MCIYFYHIIKNRGPGPYNSLQPTGNRKYFFVSVPNAKSKGSTRFAWRGKWEKFGDVLAEKKATL